MLIAQLLWDRADGVQSHGSCVMMGISQPGATLDCRPLRDTYRVYNSCADGREGP